MELRDEFEKKLAGIISGEKLDKAIMEHRKRAEKVKNMIEDFKKESEESINKLAKDADEKRLALQKELSRGIGVILNGLPSR